MNFKKIITGVVVGAMAVSAMAVSAFAEAEAEATKTNFDAKLYISGTAFGDPVNISKDGEYTFKAENLDFAPGTIWAIFVKDAYAQDKGEDLEEGYKTPLAEGFSVESFKMKVNGKDVEVNEDLFLKNMKDNQKQPGYKFDYCVYFTWGDPYVTLPDETITSVEITITVISGNPAEPEVPDSEATESEATESEATDDSQATEPEASDSNATEPEVSGTEGTADVTSGVAGSTNGGSDDKGNQPTGIVFAVIPAVAAAAAVVVSKKRK